MRCLVPCQADSYPGAAGQPRDVVCLLHDCVSRLNHCFPTGSAFTTARLHTHFSYQMTSSPSATSHSALHHPTELRYAWDFTGLSSTTTSLSDSVSSKDASWAAGGTTKTKGIDLGTSDWISLALTGENIANRGQAFTVEIVFRTDEIPAGDRTLFQCSANGDTKREDGIFLMLKDSGEKMQYTIYSGTGRFVFHNALRLSPPLASRHFPSPPVPSPRVTHHFPSPPDRITLQPET